MIRAAVRTALLCMVLLLASVRTVAAQPPQPGIDEQLDSARAQRGRNLQVTLVTLGPGNAIFEKFGHNALVVRDTTTGQAYAYNWGMFDFNQPNFVGRFLTGDTRYWAAAFDAQEWIYGSMQENRTIRSQRLLFTDVERGALFDYLRWNLDGENAYYRYDYYRDNCSTRIRDLIDWVLKGQLKEQLDVAGEGITWRSETRRLLSGSLPAYAGIQVALGRNADRPLTRWEEGFIPSRLADNVAAAARVENGLRYRIVTDDTVLFAADRAPLRSEPPDWLVMCVLLGLTLAGLIAVFTDSRLRGTRGVLVVCVFFWYLVTGIAGTALLLAATVTRHAGYMGYNTMLFVVTPLALFASVLATRALWTRQHSRAASIVAGSIGVLSVFAVLLQLVPAARQHSGEAMAILVPVNVALALAVIRLGNGHSRHS